MKRVFIITALACLLICSLFSLSACGDEESRYGLKERGGKLILTVPCNDEPVSFEVERYPYASISDYVIVRSDLASEEIIKAMQTVKHAVDDAGINLKLTTDWVKRGEEVPVGTREILIGETNRPESPNGRNVRAKDYIIKKIGERIVIGGGTIRGTAEAAQLFADYFVDAETNSLLIPVEGYHYSAPYVFDNLSINGCPIQDYMIELKAGDKSAAAALEDFVADLTGFAMLDESEHKIVIGAGGLGRGEVASYRADGKNIYITAASGEYSLTAVRFFITQLVEQGDISMFSIHQSADLTVSSETVGVTEDDIAGMPPTFIYVSCDGDDTNDGSEEHPLATLAGARDALRKVASTSLSPIKVLFRGGEYRVDSAVSFTEADSGTKAAPITFAAYPGETPVFIGGVHVAAEDVVPCTEESILSRVTDPEAKAQLMQIDLSSYVEVIPDIYSFGHTENDANKPVAIYCGETPLTRSRWPNADEDMPYLRTADEVRASGDSKVISYGQDALARAKTWSEESLDDLYIFGFLAYDWTNETYDASGISRGAKTITLKGGLNSYFNSITGNKRFYFFNLPEEIDKPGESYIDRENRIVYFYPPEGFDTSKVVVSTTVDTLLSFDGCSHVVIEGLTFGYTRGNALTVSNADDFTLRNCTIAHTSHNGGSFSGTNITLTGCTIYDTAAGGFSVSGGDRASLTHSGNVVEYCTIHDINRDQSTYKPAIGANACGMVVRNNTLYNGVHEMIAVGSNDIIIEYNEIYDCVSEAADMGAIYFGRDPVLMGTVIRYNYFHDIGNPYDDSIGQQAIFIDDGNNGAEIYGNVFYRATVTSAAIKTHGAQFSHIYNNIFAEMPAAYQNSDWVGSGADGYQMRWFQWLYDRYPANQHEILAKFNGNNADSELWRSHYAGTIWAQVYDYISDEKIAEYKAMSDTDFDALAHTAAPRSSNIMEGNIIISVAKPLSGGIATVENNLETPVGGALFKSYGEDFTLTDRGLSEVRKVYPDFKQIPFEKIGNRKK